MASNGMPYHPAVEKFFDTIVHILATNYAQTLIESECIAVHLDGEAWCDLTTMTEVPVAEAFSAVSYLDHKQLLRRHSSRNTLVQVIVKPGSSFEEVAS